MVKKHGMHFAGSSKVKISEFFSMRSLKFYGDRYPVYYSYSSSIYHEILDQSLINDLEDFIFHHFEFTILCCSCKQGIGILLIDVFVFFLCVETWGKTCMRIFVLIAFIWDHQVMTTSECWSVIWMAVDQILHTKSCKFIHQIKRHQECSLRLIPVKPFVCCVPHVMSKATNSFAKLSLDESKCVRNIVTVFVESRGWEVIFGGSEKKFNFFWIF